MKLITFIFCEMILFVNCEISITKIEMRPPKRNDIGLIFDVSLINIVNNKDKDNNDVKIRSDRCCLQLPFNETFCNVAKVLGGSFGTLEPGNSKIVSVVWPTVTLYNRVGFCDVTVLSSNNSYTNENAVSRVVDFDTTIRTDNIPSYMKLFVAGLNFTDCETIDLNPFKKCEPANCEEKYFGARSFYNHTSHMCEPVPKCIGKNLAYDFVINECIDVNRLICQEEIDDIRNGKYDNNFWQLKKTPKTSNQDFYEYSDLPMEPYEKPKRDIRSPIIGFFNGLFVILCAAGVYLGFCLCICLALMILSNPHIVVFTSQPNGNEKTNIE